MIIKKIEKYCVKLKKEYELFLIDKNVIRLKAMAVLYKTIEVLCNKYYISDKLLLKYINYEEVKKILLEYNLYCATVTNNKKN